ncbi:uncharacterized protein LOC108035112 [Drosophila biarmipes]|uniref:uncharacterized protein LOC108035112 n=1 Tax=Drosophila biarmipes TaxID=125945 RepID=UPI0007E5F354|nr:uncharacterized protein LOC108035112 [Drosophila biarmipes]
MRSLILVALLAFLAVGFVAARPAEDEESSSSSVVDASTDSSSNADESTEANEEQSEGSSDDESTTEASSDDESSGEVKKHIRPFWPRFGGHGPVVVRRHPGFETI